MGRKPLPKSQHKDEVVNVRLDDSLSKGLDAFVKANAEHELSRSAAIRKLLRQALGINV